MGFLLSTPRPPQSNSATLAEISYQTDILNKFRDTGIVSEKGQVLQLNQAIPLIDRYVDTTIGVNQYLEPGVIEYAFTYAGANLNENNNLANYNNIVTYIMKKYTNF